MIPCCKGKVYSPLPNQGSRKVSIGLVVVDNIDVAIKNEDGDITNIVELKSKIVKYI